MSEKKRKYIDLIKLARDVKKGIKATVQNKKAKNQLEGAIIDIEGNIEDYKLKILDSKMEFPFNLKDILNWTNKLQLEERKLKQAKELKEELF